MIKNDKKKLICNESGRIDKVLSTILNISRNKVQELLISNNILVNNTIINKSNFLLAPNDLIEIKNNEIKDINKYLTDEVKPFKTKLDILYEDEYFLIINKPSGMLTHPTKFNEDNTLLNACVYYFNEQRIKEDPWIVHRLDKDTSGLIIVAKGLETLNVLQKIFNERNVIKKYYALVNDCLKEQRLIIDVPIARSFQNKLKMNAINGKNPKESQTGVELIENYKNSALVSCELFTGRTHQIRVHLKHINHPILNDPLYGLEEKTSEYGQYLHSYFLSFIHPYKNIKIEIKTELPFEFKEKIKKLKI